MGNSCPCLSHSDSFITDCLSLSDDLEIQNLKQSDYKKAKNPLKEQDYKILPNEGKKYVIYERSQFYYEGQTKVQEDSNNPEAFPNLVYAHGKGIMRWPKQSSEKDASKKVITYDGDFKDNRRDGIGDYIEFFNELQFKYSGKWNNNLPTSGSLIINNKKIAQIQELQFVNQPSEQSFYLGFINNHQKWDGCRVKICFENSKNVYDGNFKWNQQLNKYQFHGNGNLKIPQKNEEYDGEWNEGLFHGKGTYKWNELNNRCQFRGYYINGVKQGNGKLYFDNMNKYIEGKWLAGKKQGKFNLRNSEKPEEIIKEIQFQHDVVKS